MLGFSPPIPVDMTRLAAPSSSSPSCCRVSAENALNPGPAARTSRQDTPSAGDTNAGPCRCASVCACTCVRMYARLRACLRMRACAFASGRVGEGGEGGSRTSLVQEGLPEPLTRPVLLEDKRAGRRPALLGGGAAACLAYSCSRDSR